MLLRFKLIRSVALNIVFAAALGGVVPARRQAVVSPTDSRYERFVSSTGNDNSDGSRARPWATLNFAAAHVRPGMTVHVGQGVYAPVTTSISGLPDARIRWISDRKWQARVQSVSGAPTWTNQADYIDIIGFDISGNGNLGIVNWGSGVRIAHNHVHHILAAGCPKDGGAGIVNANYSGRDNEIDSNVVHDVGDLTLLCPRVHGIYHSNVHGRVTNNLAYRNEGFGIHLWHAASDVVIANNLVFNNYYGGILIGAGDAPYRGVSTHPADDILVINNIVIYNLHRFGIEEMGVTGWNLQYVNNLVYENQNADWRLKTGRQTGTLSTDPQFVYYSPNGDGDYHLRASSPAIATGTGRNAPTLDIEGRTRPRGNEWDIGPYQFGPTLTQAWPPRN